MTEPLSLASSISELAKRLKRVADSLLTEANSDEHLVGASLPACHSKIELILEKLLMWRELWVVNDSPDESRLEIVWSQTAIESVRKVVGRISETLSKLESSNSRLRPASVKQSQHGPKKRSLK